ncbi:hypothetical protein Pcinc_006489 [Petrolisthes cinctipes]|uniref:Uncharacterized protein n=1 Tax=Petrolisthes cinctipes TaxID=88211 RepID=A0AAE1GCZ3_PETCI|nr:hypothetical protein Pcinc_006489 [Petrolisthes cinctipes]
MALFMEKVQKEESINTRSSLGRRVTTSSLVDHTRRRPLRDHSAKEVRNFRSSLTTTTITHHDILLNCDFVNTQVKEKKIFLTEHLSDITLSFISLLLLTSRNHSPVKEDHLEHMGTVNQVTIDGIYVKEI